MSTILISNGGYVQQDPADLKLYLFDWDANSLALGVIITSSSFSIKAIRPSVTDAALVKDNESVLPSQRQTQLRLSGGTLGQTYEVANKIITNETPSQTKERSFRVVIANL